MALSGWKIDDVELPEAPTFDDRVINRTFQSETLFIFFPELTKSTARSSDYTLKSIIYPIAKAQLLDQIASSADTADVILTVPQSEQLFPATKFAVKTLKLTRQGPLFVPNAEISPGVFETVAAIPFEITVTQLPDEGETTEGIDGFEESDEGGLGLVPLQELIDVWTPIGGVGPTKIGEFGPYELFQNPELGIVVGIPKVQAEI